MPFVPVPSQIDFVFVFNFSNCANYQCCNEGEATLENVHEEEHYTVSPDGLVSDASRGAMLCSCGFDPKPSNAELALRAETLMNVHSVIQTRVGGGDDGFEFANFVGYLGHVNWWKLQAERNKKGAGIKGKYIVRIEESYRQAYEYWPKVKEVFEELKQLPKASSYASEEAFVTDDKVSELFNKRELSVLNALLCGCGPCKIELEDLDYIQSRHDITHLADTDIDPEVYPQGEKAAKQIYALARAFKDCLCPDDDDNANIVFPERVEQLIKFKMNEWEVLPLDTKPL